MWYYPFQSSLKILLLLLLCISKQVDSQNPVDFTNRIFLERLNSDSSYLKLRKKVVNEYVHAQPGRWGEFVNGVYEDLYTQQKFIAFTFDACGGEKGNGYDEELINFLKTEKVPATLFISGRWIDAHFSTFLNLSKDTLFEIENHGLNHRPCSIDGESEYGIHGTANVAEAFDEIEANARKIETLTGRRPHFYRSATAFIDEACARLAHELGIIAVSFQVLSGDAVPNTSISTIEENVMKNIRPGAIVIMHMNHPDWNTCEAMQKIVPELRKMGYHFVRLNNFKLANRKGQL
jgi:peptidoglycan/xylan/chitin deacetylase (PgdA/CDA1 family)